MCFKYFKSIIDLLSFRSHHTNLFGLNYLDLQRHELVTALNWYHSTNEYGKLWQIQNRRHSRHQKVLGFLNFPEMLIVWLNLFNVNSSKKNGNRNKTFSQKSFFLNPRHFINENSHILIREISLLMSNPWK